MPRVFLTPFVIAGLLLLPSCSSAQEPADKPQVKSECDEVKEKYEDFNELANKYPSYSSEYKVLYLAKHYYLLENNSCFSSVEIATTKAAIDVYNSQNNK